MRREEERGGGGGRGRGGVVKEGEVVSRDNLTLYK